MTQIYFIVLYTKENLKKQIIINHLKKLKKKLNKE